MDTLKTSSPLRWTVRGFKLKDERELYGLAELMKKGLQVDAHSPIFKIDSKSGVLVLSGMSLFRRQHEVHRVRALDGQTFVGLARQGGLRGRKIPVDNILYLHDQIQVTITVNVLH